MDFPGKETLWGALGAFVGGVGMTWLKRIWDKTDANEEAKSRYELASLGKMVERIESLEKALDAERKRCDQDRENAREKYLDLALKYERVSLELEQLRKELRQHHGKPFDSISS